MFPRVSFIMMLCAGLLLIAASVVNSFSGNQVNIIYLGIGVLFTLFATIMLVFQKKK